MFSYYIQASCKNLMCSRNKKSLLEKKNRYFSKIARWLLLMLRTYQGFEKD